MPRPRTLSNSERFQLTLERLTHQLIENYGDFSDTCLVGIQYKGAVLASRIQKHILEAKGVEVQLGKLDVTFYRDDFRTRKSPLSAYPTEMDDIILEDKRVILIDDVLYTGRTIRSAMSALLHYGRPTQIELLCMVDRQFNRHLPIQANYKGLTIDSVDEAYVKVQWEEEDGEDKILLYSKKVE